MKKALVFVTLALLGANVVYAAVTQADLAPAAIQAKVKALPRDQRQAYAKEVIEAISAQPISNEEKAEQILSASRALLAGARTTGVIAEIFNSVPADILPGVAEQLAKRNFTQSANGYNDEQWNEFCTRVVSLCSDYIASSGTDAPALRQGVLVGSFTMASENPESSRSAMLAVLPAATAGAAAIYSDAMVSGNTEVLSEGAGVDEVAETPADPDEDNVVRADDSYLTPSAPENTTTATPGDDDEDVVEVPLLNRYSDDILGITLDNSFGTLYNWDDAANELRPTYPSMDNAIVVGTDEQVPAGATPAPADDVEEPSPLYGGQGN